MRIIKTLSQEKERRFEKLTKLSLERKLTDSEALEYAKLADEKNLNDFETKEFVKDSVHIESIKRKGLK